MWIILPLIYFMSWRSYRRFGQAFSETAAWVFGYLAATGILLALHFGGVGLISATPDDPTAVFAIVGGFIGMGISRYLWKRRGGHLEPVNNPLASLMSSRWVRGVRAMLFSGKSKSKSRSQAQFRRSTTTTTTTSPSSPRQSSAPQAKTNPTAQANRPTATRTTGQTGKSSAQKWGRVLGAMMTPSDSQRRPPR